MKHDKPQRVISECPMREGAQNQDVWISECPATAGQFVRPQMGDIDPRNMVSERIVRYIRRPYVANV